MHSDLLDRAPLLTQKLPKQGYVDPRLMYVIAKNILRLSSHYDLVDSYEISTSQNISYDNDRAFPFMYI